MVLFKLFLLTLAFGNGVGASLCPEGQRIIVKGSRNSCADCPDGQFQSVRNPSQRCRMCTRCDKASGSVTVEHCTRTSNTKCECDAGFVPADDDFSSCKCDMGSGLRDNACKPCEDGYFNNAINSPCKKWKECKPAGVKINGTKTSDVVCNEGFISYVTTPRTSSKVPSSVTKLTTHRQREGAQRETTTLTTATPGHTFTSKEKVPQPSNTGNHTGVVLVIFVIAGLLVLTAVTCKLHNTPCVLRKPAAQKHDSLCRRPVEESGEGSESPLKPNQLHIRDENYTVNYTIRA